MDNFFPEINLLTHQSPSPIPRSSSQSSRALQIQWNCSPQPALIWEEEGRGGREEGGGRGRKVGEGSIFCNPHFTSRIKHSNRTYQHDSRVGNLYDRGRYGEEADTPNITTERPNIRSVYCTLVSVLWYMNIPELFHFLLTSCWLPFV